jgi:hypothetical protein
MRALLAMLLVIGLAEPAAAAQVRNFFAPEVEGARIDACLDSGQCGKPAADAFCRGEGYDRAMLFQRESIASARSIQTGKTCSGSCTALRQVKCFTTKNDLAGGPERG